VHIRAARASALPLVVHTRNASRDTVDLLRSEGAGQVRGVFHCFTETQDVADAALELGFHISFSGILTFKNAEALRDVARRVPLERCLIETDSPYLAPVPYRGKTNQPAYVAHVAAQLAQLKACSVEEVARATSDNFDRLFARTRTHQTEMKMMRKYFRFGVYLFVITFFLQAKASSYVDFFRAVNVDNAGKVAELLNRGFDPNTLSESGQVALYLAMREDCPNVATVLLASPTLKIDAANAIGETALMMAALNGRLDWAKKLLERGAQVQKPGWSPVHYAASGPSTEVLALLLDRGADLNARAPNGSTPLMMAARYGTEDSVKLLVQRGADKKLLNDRNLSAADLARNIDRTWLLPWLE
jgi:uncharacterized protein